MIKEAIILAGGKGTRLKEITKDIPKPIIEINNRPFLHYILEYLLTYRVKRVIISVGYKYEKIISLIGNSYKDIEVIYVIENELLGTGGGLKKALLETNNNDILVLNGDTIFNINLKKFYEDYKFMNYNFFIAAKKVNGVSRYGALEIDSKNRITSFLEKKDSNYLINGGIYIINKDEILKSFNEYKFSLEEFLSKNINDLSIGCSIFDNYFIDIGVPEDLERSKIELKELI